jgi:hypothetical protein
MFLPAQEAIYHTVEMGDMGSGAVKQVPERVGPRRQRTSDSGFLSRLWYGLFQPFYQGRKS